VDIEKGLTLPPPAIKGVARKLLREAESIAQSWGYRELLLEVSAQNEPAIRCESRV